MKYILAGLLCASASVLAQGGKKSVVAIGVQASSNLYTAAPLASSVSALSTDTTYLSSTDFSGTGTVSDPIRIRTSAIQTWLQSLPGYSAGGGKYLASDFTWKTVNTATTLPQLAAPSLTATAVSSSAIQLSWTDVANETGYLLQRSQDNSTWVTVANTGANSTQFTNSGLSPATLYYFRVKALGDNSAYSDSPYGTDSRSTLTGGAGPVSSTLLFNLATAVQVEQHPDGLGVYYSAEGSGIAQAQKKLAAGTDGLVYFQYTAGSDELVSLGYTTNNAVLGYEHWTGGLIINSGEVKAIGYNGSTSSLGAASVNGNYYGFRRNNGTIEIITGNDEVNWTVLGYANYSPDDLYIQVYFQTPAAKAKVLAQNLVSY